MGVTSPLRILVVSDVSPLQIEGGGERVLWEQASRLAKRGHRVRVVSRSVRDSMPGTIERQGVQIHHFPADRHSLLRFLVSAVRRAGQAVDRVLTEEPADVLHLYQPLSGFGALKSDRTKGLPCLYTFLSPAPLEYLSRRGMTGHHRPGLVGRAAQVVLWGIERACLRRASRIHVLSDFSADQLWRLYGIPSNRIVKIPGGVDIDRFHPTSDCGALREALGLPARSPLLLTVRNLEARMGLDTLIQAVAILRRTLPEVLLVIGGAGSLRAPLESLVDSLKLQTHVRFLGFIPDGVLPQYYQAADAFVLPTRELEGFGLITVEALACGTPVLGTAVGATPEILDPLDPSLVLRVATPEAMAEQLREFLVSAGQDQAAAARKRAACRRHAEALYNWHTVVGSLEQSLQRLARDQPDLAKPAQPCPACGGFAQESHLTYIGTPYFHCSHCGTDMAAGIPTAASLRRFYDSEYPRRFHDDCVAEPRLELFASILDRLQTVGSIGRLLDVGCGGGHLLAAARTRGLQTVGIDLSHQACAVAHRAGIPAIQAESMALPLRQRYLGAVSLVNVLDQTSDPMGTLREAYRVLAPGGHLVIRIPNATFHRPWVRLLTSLGPLVRWHGWDRYPTLHLFAFTRRSLCALGGRAGFAVLEVRNSPPAAAGLTRAQTGGRSTGMRLLNSCVFVVASSVESLSRGRWLLGPSIELYAQKSPSGGMGKP